MIPNTNIIFACFIIAICLIMAYFVAFTELWNDKLQGNTRTIFVGMMLLYAVFRSYRLVKAFKEQNRKNEE